MATEINPGQWVKVTVKKQPRAAAKVKTLVKLCEKDAKVKLERTRLSRSRPTRFDRRGGRLWGDRPPRLPVVKTTPGASYRIFGSLDVIRELKSLGDCVDVKPA